MCNVLSARNPGRRGGGEKGGGGVKGEGGAPPGVPSRSNASLSQAMCGDLPCGRMSPLRSLALALGRTLARMITVDYGLASPPPGASSGKGQW